MYESNNSLTNENEFGHNKFKQHQNRVSSLQRITLKLSSLKGVISTKSSDRKSACRVNESLKKDLN